MNVKNNYFLTSLISILLLMFSNLGHARSMTDTIRDFMSGQWDAGFSLAFASTQLESLDSSNSLNIFVQHKVGYNMGIEASYFSTGDFEFDENIIANTQTSAQGFAFSILGFSEPSFFDLTFFGKLGALIWEEDFTAGGFSGDSDSGTSLFLGFGTEKSLNEKLTLFGETNYYFDVVRKGWVHTIGAGIKLRFK